MTDSIRTTFILIKAQLVDVLERSGFGDTELAEQDIFKGQVAALEMAHAPARGDVIRTAGHVWEVLERAWEVETLVFHHQESDAGGRLGDLSESRHVRVRCFLRVRAWESS